MQRGPGDEDLGTGVIQCLHFVVVIVAHLLFL
jgi:hypothetical protein